MRTREILKRLKRNGTKIQLDKFKKEESDVFLGDLAQVLVRAYNNSDKELVNELYEGVVCQQKTTDSSKLEEEVRHYAKKNLDWISQLVDKYGIKNRGDVGNAPFVINALSKDCGPTKKITGPVNKFYRESMNYSL